MTSSLAVSSSSNLADMTAPTLLVDLRKAAEAAEVRYRTMQNYHQTAARHRRTNEVRPGDLPPPDDTYGRSPVWRLSTIQEWMRARPGRGVGGGRVHKNDAGYKALHLRVTKARGRPSLCDWCDETDPTEGFEWANLSGNYGDVNDYVRLCVTCHRTYDANRVRS